MGFQDQVRQLTVVGEEDQAEGMIFQAAYGKHALRHAVEHVGEGAAAFGVDHGGDDFGRLIEDEIDALGFWAEEFALHFDVVFGFVGFATEFGNGLAVYGDEAGFDQFFGVAAGGDAGARNDFL